jgi:subtilisin family serine protease
MIRKIKFVIIMSVLFLSVLFLSQATPRALANGDAIPNQYIIVLADGVEATAVANEMAQAHGLGLGHVYSNALQGFAANVPAARLNGLQNDPRVLSVTPDLYVSIAQPPCGTPRGGPCDDDGGGGGQTIPTGILRINGDLSSTASGDGAGSVDVDVAVIDTGIDIDHSDLNVVGGVNCSVGNSYNDGNGHGTHVSGTIGALDNDNGVVGVAPGARMWAVRVLNNAGSGTRSDVICGIDWVTANADTIEVANMSLGGSGTDDGLSCSETTDPYKIAICNSVAAGVTYAVAAGNDSADAADSVPAAYDMVITVSALADFDGEPGGLAASTCRSDEDDTFANFSNYGADVDIIAPGVCILSTWNDGGTNTISGTSMASPHVAGAAALYKANNPSATPAQVQDALQNAGNFDWDNSDDGDSTKEPLLDVGGF